MWESKETFRKEKDFATFREGGPKANQLLFGQTKEGE
jgi:hypothetical protein